MPRDWKKFPELWNNELDLIWESPHYQILEDWEGKCVKVIDGDTIRVTHPRRDFETVVRLFGINAPELSEGGGDVRDWLKEKIEGKRVRLNIAEERVGRWGRILANVEWSGLDLGEWMLNGGMVTTFEESDE